MQRPGGESHLNEHGGPLTFKGKRTSFPSHVNLGTFIAHDINNIGNARGSLNGTRAILKVKVVASDTNCGGG